MQHRWHARAVLLQHMRDAPRRKLWLGGNRLTTVPAALAAATTLQMLVLEDNLLGELPAALGAMPALQPIVVDGNPSLRVPAELAHMIAPAYARGISSGRN